MASNDGQSFDDLSLDNQLSDDDMDFLIDEEAVDQEQYYECYHEVLTTEQTLQYTDECVREVQDGVGTLLSVIRALLNLFRWDKQQLLEC